MLRIGYLTKRKDACWWVRILNPMSMLGNHGHQVYTDTMELNENCHSCHTGMHEFAFLDKRKEFTCPNCGAVIIEEKKVDLWRKAVWKLIEVSDLVVFQRPTTKLAVELMKKVKFMGKKITQTSDDNYINVPVKNPGYSYYMSQQEHIVESHKIVDAVDVTNPWLKQFYEKLNDHVDVLPNCQDIEFIDVMPEPSVIPIMNSAMKQITTEDFFKVRKNSRVVIWGGSPTHEDDLAIVLNSVRRITRSFEDVIFVMVGFMHRGFLDVIPKNRLFITPVVTHQMYFPLYKKINAEFGITPVVDDEFGKGKSSNKAIELCINRTLPIMSDVITYQGCCPKGIYAKNNDASWFYAMKQALEMSKDEYHSRVEENRKYVEDNHDIGKKYTDWISHYERVLNK